ncbi:MAG: DUF2516 family protein [Aeromicrobium sp.]
MFDLFAVQNSIMLLISLALFIIKCWAVVDCVARPESKFQAIDTLPKQTWVVLLGLGLLANLLFWNPLGLLNLAGTVAALVYLAQVRGSD